MAAALVAYLSLLFRFRSAGVDHERVEGHSDESASASSWQREGVWVIGGLLAILAASKLLVFGASGIARAYGMSDWAIGVTIVAAGTSAPEFVTALMGVIKGRHGISAGALIGSDIYNLLGVLGVASLITPLHVDVVGVQSVYVLVGMVTLVWLMMRVGWKLSRWQGALLVGLNAVRWWFDLRAGGGTPPV